MEVGIENNENMAVPSSQVAWPLLGHCPSECTKLGIPEGGFHVLAGSMHTSKRSTRGNN